MAESLASEGVGTGVRRMTSARTYGAVLCLAVLVIAAIAACNLAAAAPAGGLIRVPLPESDAAIYIDANGLAAFSGTDVQRIGQTGEPSLPCQSIRVLLPPDTDLSTVRAIITGCEWTGIDGEWDISPVMPYVRGDGEDTCAVSLADEAIAGSRDAGIYESDALFPGEPVRKVDVQVMRGWKMAQVLYAPMAYNPVEKKLFQLSGSAIEITFERTSLDSSSAGTDLTSAEQVRDMTVNFTEMAGEYGSYVVSADTGGYVIITTSAIQTASDNLDDFVANKQARGFNVQVVTEGTWGGGTGDHAAEHIRSWLQDNYLDLDVKYVLLIGNPNPTTGDVPMKMCYPQASDAGYPDCPTDFYYAELTSDWDTENGGTGDGRYGEYWDDFSGTPPRAAEVAVGRIPYYGSSADLDHILSKIIGYEAMPETDISWRRNVLLPMKASDGSTLGYQLGEEIKDDILVPNGWTYYRVYDEDYDLDPDPETIPCTVTNVTNAWNGSDFGAVFWWTHGSGTAAVDIMNLDNATTLHDDHPAFAFQCSCLNGKPETTNNLGYSLLRNGCISTVSASRVSWYEPGQTSFAGTATNSGMTFEYAKRLIAGEMYAGDALNDLKLDVSPGFEELWMNYLDFNLYGCPAVGLYTPPLAETDDATTITTSTAQLHAGLVSLGTADSVVASFEWGTASGGPYPNLTENQTLTAPGTFSDNLTGLHPGTTYYYRAKAVGWGTGYGLEMSFTTLTIPPSAETLDATNITNTSAQLKGSLTSIGTADSVTVSFEWGSAPGGPYPYHTDNQTLIAPDPFSAGLSDLTPGNVYYFRAKAVGDGTTYGLVKSLTAAVTPSVATRNATDVAGTSAQLNGSLTSLGATDNVMVSFLWGTASGGLTNETTGQIMTTSGTFRFNLGSLAPGITYYFKAKAVGEGTVYGAENDFTTLRPPEVGSVAPGNGSLGQGLTVIITGANFSGAPVVSFGADMVVEGITVVSAAQMNVAVHIRCDGTPGIRDVAVTTLGGTDALPNSFAVTDSAPDQPQNASPADDAGIMTLTPTLSASVFSHVCLLSTHAASQWQVTAVSGDYSNPLDDTTVRGGDLTSFELPTGVMGSPQQYWWRVRYQDNGGAWSDWSEETSFKRPDFIQVKLNGSAEIRVYDYTSGVTGSVDGEAREEIAHSEYVSGTVVLISPTGSYQYQVVGLEDGSYALTVIRAVGNESVVLRAVEIPVSDGEVHQYAIDWEALSRGAKSVTVSIDSDGDDTFEKTVLMEGEINANEFASATKDPEIPVWAWILVGIGVIAGIAILLALLRADRLKRQDRAAA